MKKLKLNFLNDPHFVTPPSLITILEECGKEISTYASDYFSHAVILSSDERSLTSFSLYIIAPEIAFDYKVINVELLSISSLRISFYTILTKQSEHYDISISEGTEQYENKVRDILSSNLFNASLKFLVDQILLKREHNSIEVREKIVIGQAKVAKLKTGERINAGFLRMEGDEVYYYTGKGLRLMFKPDMNEEEQNEANRLKNLSEEEQLENQLLAKKNIQDFEDIE